ncbi:Potassium channel tetramerization-type BTB domain-containing protein [Plasmodiophora brassicae]
MQHLELNVPKPAPPASRKASAKAVRARASTPKSTEGSPPVTASPKRTGSALHRFLAAQGAEQIRSSLDGLHRRMKEQESKVQAVIAQRVDSDSNPGTDSPGTHRSVSERTTSALVEGSPSPPPLPSPVAESPGSPRKQLDRAMAEGITAPTLPETTMDGLDDARLAPSPPVPILQGDNFLNDLSPPRSIEDDDKGASHSTSTVLAQSPHESPEREATSRSPSPPASNSCSSPSAHLHDDGDDGSASESCFLAAVIEKVAGALPDPEVLAVPCSDTNVSQPTDCDSLSDPEHPVGTSLSHDLDDVVVASAPIQVEPATGAMEGDTSPAMLPPDPSPLPVDVNDMEDGTAPGDVENYTAGEGGAFDTNDGILNRIRAEIGDAVDRQDDATPADLSTTHHSLSARIQADPGGHHLSTSSPAGHDDERVEPAATTLLEAVQGEAQRPASPSAIFSSVLKRFEEFVERRASPTDIVTNVERGPTAWSTLSRPPSAAISEHSLTDDDTFMTAEQGPLEDQCDVEGASNHSDDDPCLSSPGEFAQDDTSSSASDTWNAPHGEPEFGQSLSDGEDEDGVTSAAISVADERDAMPGLNQDRPAEQATFASDPPDDSADEDVEGDVAPADKRGSAGGCSPAVSHSTIERRSRSPPNDSAPSSPHTPHCSPAAWPDLPEPTPDVCVLPDSDPGFERSSDADVVPTVVETPSAAPCAPPPHCEPSSPGCASNTGAVSHERLPDLPEPTPGVCVLPDSGTGFEHSSNAVVVPAAVETPSAAPCTPPLHCEPSPPGCASNTGAVSDDRCSPGVPPVAVSSTGASSAVSVIGAEFPETLDPPTGRGDGAPRPDAACSPENIRRGDEAFGPADSGAGNSHRASAIAADFTMDGGGRLGDRPALVDASIDRAQSVDRLDEEPPLDGPCDAVELGMSPSSTQVAPSRSGTWNDPSVSPTRIAALEQYRVDRRRRLRLEPASGALSDDSLTDPSPSVAPSPSAPATSIGPERPLPATTPHRAPRRRVVLIRKRAPAPACRETQGPSDRDQLGTGPAPSRLDRGEPRDERRQSDVEGEPVEPDGREHPVVDKRDAETDAAPITCCYAARCPACPAPIVTENSSVQAVPTVSDASADPVPGPAAYSIELQTDPPPVRIDSNTQVEARVTAHKSVQTDSSGGELTKPAVVTTRIKPCSTTTSTSMDFADLDLTVDTFMQSLSRTRNRPAPSVIVNDDALRDDVSRSVFALDGSGVPNQRMGPRSLIPLNIGGQRFEVLRSTLMRYPDSLLAKIGRSASPLYIDRSPTYFPLIVDLFRTGKPIGLPASAAVDLEALRQEARFYNVEQQMFPNGIPSVKPAANEKTHTDNAPDPAAGSPAQFELHERCLLTPGMSVTFSTRSNEVLVLDTIAGKGRLLFDSEMSARPESNVTGAVVFDSDAHISTGPGDTIPIGNVYPASGKYTFHMSQPRQLEGCPGDMDVVCVFCGHSQRRQQDPGRLSLCATCHARLPDPQQPLAQPQHGGQSEQLTVCIRIICTCNNHNQSRHRDRRTGHPSYRLEEKQFQCRGHHRRPRNVLMHTDRR